MRGRQLPPAFPHLVPGCVDAAKALLSGGVTRAGPMPGHPVPDDDFTFSVELRLYFVLFVARHSGLQASAVRCGAVRRSHDAQFLPRRGCVRTYVAPTPQPPRLYSIVDVHYLPIKI